MLIRKILVTAGLLVVSASAHAADSYVNGYYRSNGTYVQSHHRSTPDNTINNNYGTQGNLNVYTGQSGTIQRNPYQSQGNYNLGNGQGTLPKQHKSRNPYSFDSDD